MTRHRHGGLKAAIAEHLRAAGPQSCVQIAQAVDRDWSVVHGALRALARDGVAQKSGPHNHVTWSAR